MVVFIVKFKFIIAVIMMATLSLSACDRHADNVLKDNNKIEDKTTKH